VTTPDIGKVDHSIFVLWTFYVVHKKSNIAWAILVVAGVFETRFSIGLKYGEGFTRLWPSVATAIMIALSLGLVGVATRSLPLGTAYAVWTGIGAAGTVAMGIVLFGGVCGFQPAGLPGADRYGNSRAEVSWRIAGALIGRLPFTSLLRAGL
jgi:quaternary ammonium compound-resistance protein SugE